MNYSFAIGIPTINCADLLNEALEKYFQDFANTNIFILDNGNQKINKRNKKFKIIRTKENYGVAKSWNNLCDRILKNHTHALILNDDIYLGKTEPEIAELIRSPQFDLMIPPERYSFASFILSRDCFSELRFDENFYPAYFEDNDYLYRLKLSSKEIIKTKALKPEIFRERKSIQKDKKVRGLKNSKKVGLARSYAKNKNYYIRKWGGLPYKDKGRGDDAQWSGEIYKRPFDE